MKTNKPAAPFTIPVAFLAFAGESGNPVILDPDAKLAITTDGEAIAAMPIPEGHARSLIASSGAHEDLTVLPNYGTPTDTTWPIEDLKTTAAYRIAFNPEKLAALAAALGAGELVIIEFPANPAEGPMAVRPGTGDSFGYLMPQPIPDGAEGILLETRGAETPAVTLKVGKPEVKLPPPVITTSAERKTIEVFFGGRPPKETTEAIGKNGLGFNYSGRGTKKGVPPNTWYAPDNEFFRNEISKLLKVAVLAAA